MIMAGINQQQERELSSSTDNQNQRTSYHQHRQRSSQQQTSSIQQDRPERLRHLFEPMRRMIQDVNDDNNSALLKKSSSSTISPQQSDEEHERPNKLFPVQNEKDELFRKVRSVLNKVSTVNYNRLKNQWLALMPKDDEEEELDDEPRLSINQVNEVLRLVIAKGMDDNIYQHIYAGLMGFVVEKKSSEISTKIRQLIRSQVHQELKKLSTDKELALFHRSTPMVDATRRKKVMLHRFIAELYREKVCSSKFVTERIMDLLVAGNGGRSEVSNEENIECLCVLMTFAGQKLEESKKSWVEDVFKKLEEGQNETQVSKRIQFMILDLIQMRSNGWSPHNKWWSPSVERPLSQTPRNRTTSSPTPRRNRTTSGKEAKEVNTKGGRTRTRSEGNSGTTSSDSNSTATTKQEGDDDDEQQQHGQLEDDINKKQLMKKKTRQQNKEMCWGGGIISG